MFMHVFTKFAGQPLIKSRFQGVEVKEGEVEQKSASGLHCIFIIRLTEDRSGRQDRDKHSEHLEACQTGLSCTLSSLGKQQKRHWEKHMQIKNYFQIIQTMRMQHTVGGNTTLVPLNFGRRCVPNSVTRHFL